MGLQGGILYSCNPITIYFLGNIFAETYKLIRKYILLLGSRIDVYFRRLCCFRGCGFVVEPLRE